MDRLCPYLALADDGRTVADGFDPEHRCHALTPPAPLDRARQVQLCLTEAHVRCERYGAARTAWLAASSGLPRVAPDVAFPRTRLVLEPEPAWRNLATPSARYSRRTVLVAAVAAVVVGLLVVSSLMGILGGAPGGASQTPLPSGSPIATPVATASTSPSVAASASAAASATTPATPAPSLRTYVVQQGDTLNLIAQQFGTTVQAIQAANGLTGTEINVGQVLIIP